MTLAAGTRLGPYEILSPIGAGGMGEVGSPSSRDFVDAGADAGVIVWGPAVSSA